MSGKSAASLGPGLRTSLGNFLAWYGPWTITHYCSYTWVALKLQCIVQAQLRVFRTLGWLVKDAGAHVIFCSLLPAAGSDIGRNRWAQSINTWWLCGLCHHHNIGFIDNGMAYMSLGLMASGGIHLSQRGKRSLLTSSQGSFTEL